LRNSARSITELIHSRKAVDVLKFRKDFEVFSSAVRFISKLRRTLSIILQNIRFAFRQLSKSPAQSLIAILSLGLGIAATVVIFSVLFRVLIHPFPYRDADRIVEFNIHEKIEIEYTPPIYREQIRQLRQAHSIQDVVEMGERNLTDTSADVPLDTDVVFLSGNAFPFFGVPAILGRTFLPSDDPEGQAPQPVAVLTYQYWHRRFNGNPAVVGHTLRLDGRSYTILGVMPRNFTWWDSDIYVPLDTSDASARSFMTVLRIRPGYTKAQAAAEIQPIFQQMLREHPLLEQATVDVNNITERFNHSLGKALYLLFGAVILLLVIGCTNVSILLLARGAARQLEFAVRAAVGASRGKIIGQVLTESLVLGFIGATIGVIATYRLTPFAVAMLPWQLFPNGLDVPINAPVLIFSLGIAILASVFFGLVPALQFANSEIRQVLQTHSRKSSGTISGRRLHAVLIAGQIALVLVLLTSASAAIENFRTLSTVNLGYDPTHIADFSIPVHTGSYATWSARANYLKQLRDRVAETRGIASTSLGVIGPPYSNWDFKVEILGQNATKSQVCNINFVDSEFFRSLRISLLEGRIWNESETSQGARLALVNEAFVRRYFPNGDVLGHSVRVPDLSSHPPGVLAVSRSNEWVPIIGVVGDARNNGLDEPVKPEIYLPYSFYMIDWVQLFVRAQEDPMALQTAVRRQVASVNPGQQISSPIVPMEERIQQQPEWARGHLVAELISVFSLLALLLASVGLYSVVSYSINQRTNEIGIRMALGAQRHHILIDIMKPIGISVGSGLAVGLAVSFSLRHFLRHWLGNSVQNPRLVLAVSLVLACVALLTCLTAGSRILRIHPMQALRVE
jgi:predicted permease